MSLLVVDASVGAKWFTDEAHSDYARRLLEGKNRLHVPDFFRLELDSVMSKWVRRGVMSLEEGEEVRSALGRIPLQYHPVSPLRDGAFALSVQTGRGYYDCLYLTLAVLLKGQLITADRRFFENLSQADFGKHLFWIGDVP